MKNIDQYTINLVHGIEHEPCRIVDTGFADKTVNVECDAFNKIEMELLSLLALIHSDGGHHTGAVGLEKSCADAGTVLAELRVSISNLRRHAMNVYQDRCENAYVEVSYLDAAVQALAEVRPDHPLIKDGDSPNFGVWHIQRMAIDRLQAQIKELRPYAAHASHCPANQSHPCECGLEAVVKRIDGKDLCAPSEK